MIRAKVKTRIKPVQKKNKQKKSGNAEERKECK